MDHFRGFIVLPAPLGFAGGSVVKNAPAMQEVRVRSLVGKIPQKRTWQPTLVFLPGEYHGQRSLVDYSPYIGSQRVGHD